MQGRCNLKTLSFLLFFFFFGHVSFGQSYAPFPDSSAAWGVQVDMFDGYNGNIITQHYYFLDGDTSINGNLYHSVYRGSGFLAPAIDTSAAVLFGGIREDLSKKVFFRPIGTIYFGSICQVLSDTAEYLMYDFGRAVGDTFYTETVSDTLVHVVDDIDTILIGGVMRRQFTILKGYSPSELWYSDIQVEGLGSRQDLMYPYCIPFEEIHELLCYEDPVIAFGDCFLVGVEGVRSSGLEVVIGPHPVTNHSELQAKTSYPGEIEVAIFDLQGRTVWVSKMEEDVPIRIGAIGLERGVYFYQVTVNQIARKSGKLVVQAVD